MSPPRRWDEAGACLNVALTVDDAVAIVAITRLAVLGGQSGPQIAQ